MSTKRYVLKDKKYTGPAREVLYANGDRDGGPTIVQGDDYALRGASSFNEGDMWHKIFEREGVLDLWFEEVKPKPEYKPGDWVIISRSGTLHDYDAMVIVPERGIWAKGFSFKDEWCSQFNFDNTKGQITHKADDEVVEARLIKEWEERGGGFKAHFTPVGNYDHECIQGSDYIFEEGILYVSGYGRYPIFNGKDWAEIDAVRLPKIQGYDGKDEGKSLSWGCQSINKGDITPAAIRVARMVLGNRVTMGEFDRVVEYIESRQ